MAAGVRWALRLLLLVGAGLMLAACHGGPHELVVTTTADGVDAVPGDGICEVTPGAGDCSLRAAIDEANADEHIDAIVVPSGTYPLTVAGADDDNAGGDLDLAPATDGAFELRAESPGAVVDAAGADRGLDVHGAAVVRNLGVTSAAGAGARAVAPTASFVRVSLWGNAGAGLEVAPGATANVLHSTASGNGGAGVHTGGHLNADHITVTGNGAGGLGGAGTAALGASVVADQSAGADCAIVPTSRGSNLDTDGTCGLTGTGDATVASAGLGPLRGGVLRHHVPAPGSPAVDAVPVGPLCGGAYFSADQRLVPMPQGAACDAGAVETGGFAVDATHDADDVDPGDGRCDDGTGTCTLRAAISEANATAGTDPVEVHLPPGGLFLLGIAGTDEDANATGDLDVTRPVALHGNGSTVHALRIDRPLHVTEDASLELVGTTLTGGRAHLGGGLRADAGSTTTIERSAIVDNEATGFVTCTIRFGCSGGSPDGGPGGGGGGGGAYARGDLVVRDSTIARNRLVVDGSGSGGVVVAVGAAVVTTSSGSVALDQVTVTGNLSSGSEIAGSVVAGPGTVRRSTLVDNEPTAAVLAEVSVEGSVVGGDAGACDFDVTSLGHNVLSSADQCDTLLPSDQVGPPLVVPPGHEPGADLRLPVLGSPALDAIPSGTAGLCDATTPTDQRGVPRPQGAACDVGALERAPGEDAGVAVLTEELPDAMVGAPYAAALEAASDGPVAWALPGLPAGLVLDPATGAISGVATAAGTVSMTAVAQDGDGDSAVGAVALTVDPEPVPTVAGSATRQATYKVPFTTTFTASGGIAPHSWSLVGTLPPGTSWNPATATVSGTPTAVGSFPVQVTVTGAYGASSTRTITIQVTTVDIATTALPPADVGVLYSTSLQATGGVTPYAWSLVGSLPPGLTWTPSTATIAGLPTAAGTFPLTIIATDLVGGTSSRTFSLVVRTVEIATAELPAGMEGRAYSASLAAVGGAPPLTWSVAGPLPAGLSLAPATGVISGTPTAAATVDVEVTATDANGAHDTTTLELAIAPALAITSPPFPDAHLGLAYAASATSTGGSPGTVYSALIGTRPPGLTWTTAGGVATLVGTPTTLGSYPLTLRVTDSEGFFIEQAFTVEVQPAPPPTTFVVDSAADAVDASPGDRLCADALGRCTLRAAIGEANAVGVPDVVAIGAGVDPVLSLAGRNEDANATGDLDVTATLTIDGGGATVSAAGIDRVLDHHDGHLVVRDLAVTGGDAVAFGGVHGGGVRAVADLTLEDVDVVGNVARGTSHGGGVAVVSPVGGPRSELVVDGGSVAGNVADPTDVATGRGGGIAVIRSTATVTGTSVTGNTADLGGGVAVDDAGDLTVTGAAIDGNLARQSGGGAHGAGTFEQTSITGNSAGVSGGGLTTTALTYVERSLVAGNDVTSTTGAAVHGGGIAVTGPTLELQHSTVVDNALASTGPRTGSAISHAGVGIGPAYLRWSTVADNVGSAGLGSTVAGTPAFHLEHSALAGDGVDPACGGPAAAHTTGGGNVGADASCSLTGPGDLQSLPLELAPLADNGGPTLTRLPGATSPLVDHIAGGDAACVAAGTDQRGTARPQGVGCDAGAVER